VSYPPTPAPILDAIPAPSAVRDRLAEIARERAVLKALLRVSHQAQQVRSQSPPAGQQPAKPRGCADVA
jgi:hypothetical protein